MSATTRRRAVMYLRISLDATGEGLAVARQQDECQRIIEQRGWELVGEYVDNSISASDARKNRPGYDRLARDYDAGAYDALVCYDLDRLTRQPRQLEDWIEAAEARGLALVTANGEADLTTDAGRMFARIKVTVGRAEVDRKSRRQRDAARQRSTLGRPPLGVRLTGYTVTGEVIPEEAKTVRLIFDRFNAGESLRSITRELNDTGAPTRTGRPWHPSTVRGILTNPRYAGRAIYQGQETGERGAWEPITSDDLFNVVQAKLTDPRRATNRTGTERKHLGAGLYRCGVCGDPAEPGDAPPVRSFSGARYRCKNACVNRSRGQIDDYVCAVIAERLRRSDAAELLRPTAADLTPYLDEVNRLRERLDNVAADYDAGHIDGARYAIASGKVRDELQEADRQLANHSSGAALAETLAAPDPARAFLDASLMSKRAIIEALCTVLILRGTRYSRTFNPESVVIAWHGSTATAEEGAADAS